MNEPLYDRLRHASWRRKLTPGEEAELRAWLAARPELKSDWESEAGLSEILGRLPDPGVATNFTAGVLSRIRRIGDTADSGSTASGWGWDWRRLFPKTAFALLVLGLGVFGYERHAIARRAEFARSLATVSRVAAVPGPELLRDFETIRQLDQTALPDEKLLVLLEVK
jgi:hypothetical protein